MAVVPTVDLGDPAPAPADVLIGLMSAAAGVAYAGTGRLAAGGRQAARLVATLPVGPAAPLVRRLDGSVSALARRGRHTRLALSDDATRVWQALVPAVVSAVLDELDLTEIVIERVDLAAIIDRVDVNAIAAKVDLDAIVARLDLIGLADYIVDGIDLPGIIRESSGSMASEALSGVRLQSLEADQALSRVVSRLLPRRRVPADGTETGNHP